MTETEKYAERIAKLLRKAESTTPEEAEALVEKAQHLMTLYAIDEQMLAKARGEKVREEIVKGFIRYHGAYRMALFDVGAAVARNNNCRHLIYKQNHTTPWYDELTIIGFESDVARVKLLEASLQVQLASALQTWWKAYPGKQHLTSREKYTERRDFMFAFAGIVNQRLSEAVREAKKQATANEAARSDVTTEVAEKGVALVLADRKQRVDDWMDEKYGKKLRTVSRNYSNGIGTGYMAGRAAGQKANLSNPGKVAGTKGSLGR